MDALTLSPRQSVTILDRSPDVLEVETTYAPGGDAPPNHYHPEQDEHFEVLAGTITLRLDGATATHGAGETIEIPRGGVHSMWNAGEVPTRVLWQTRPAGRTEGWFRSIDALHRTGHVRQNGSPSPFAFAVLLQEYRDTFRLAVAPDVVLRPVIGALALIGRVRGFRANPSEA